MHKHPSTVSPEDIYERPEGGQAFVLTPETAGILGAALAREQEALRSPVLTRYEAARMAKCGHFDRFGVFVVSDDAFERWRRANKVTSCSHGRYSRATIQRALEAEARQSRKRPRALTPAAR